jgi:hypothetical protein
MKKILHDFNNSMVFDSQTNERSGTNKMVPFLEGQPLIVTLSKEFCVSETPKLNGM